MAVKYKGLRSDVIFTKVEGESVLLNMKTGIYFGLDEVGTLIWERLQADDSFSDIVNYLVERFNCDKQLIIEDVTNFLTILKNKSLIEIE